MQRKTAGPHNVGRSAAALLCRYRPESVWAQIDAADKCMVLLRIILLQVGLLYVSFKNAADQADSVVLVTLYGDSLHTILPEHSSNTYKLWARLLPLSPELSLNRIFRDWSCKLPGCFFVHAH
jgi:hypothetical protein